MNKLAAQLFVLLLLPLTAFAQGGLANADKIISAKILPWAAAAGAAWCGIGLVQGFVKLSNGDQDGKDQIVRAGIGAAGCAGAAALLALVLSWAK
ncbi:hypothetical protein [Corallococcus sp. AB038B]|uniref:hypothetical protein n=1 Tax=Corallococcus sp. AB038B TaxID=2316718 RepID=UPI000EEE5E7B|nr:hypothetical protein [Corallococcus sp. AB038B]RKH92972.1 hypothetical protein D7Y04_41865 [Corallococcus sp. AB038B]